MAISREFIDELKYKNSITDVIGSYIEIKRAGRNLKCKCPFHNETDASFVIYPDTQSFYCFGCGAAGDAITFVMKMEGLDYINAVQLLADKAGLEVPKQNSSDEKADREKKKVLEINKRSARIYYETLASKEGITARKYLSSRRIIPETIAKFGIGYASDEWDFLSNKLIAEGYLAKDLVMSGMSIKGKNGNLYDRFRSRVMIPIINIRNEIIGFGGRLLEGDGPKYLNSMDTILFKKSRNLFAINFARSSKDKNFILCEGYMDVISLHQAGFTNAVATLGTALTKEQAYFISNYREEVVVNYDGDEAGRKATYRAIDVFDTLPIRVTVAELPGGMDPDDFIKEKGIDRYKNLIENSLYSTDYILKTIKSHFNLKEENERVIYLKESINALSKLSNEAEADIYAGKVAQELSLDVSVVKQQLKNIRSKTNVKQSYDNLERTLEESDNMMKVPENVKKAEEEIIGICYNYQGDYESLFKIVDFEDMVTKETTEILSMIKENVEAGKVVTVDTARENLDENSFSKFIYSINRYSKVPLDFEHIREYVDLIKTYSHHKTRQEIKNMEIDDYTRYIESLKDKKIKGS